MNTKQYSSLPRIPSARTLFALTLTGLLCGMVSLQAQTAVSTFNSPSDYPGSAGDGWAAGWGGFNNAGTGRSISIQDSDPLEGDNGYLNNIITINTTHTGVRGGGSYRELDTNVFDLSEAFTVSFLFRGNDAATTNGPYRVFQNTIATSGTGSSNTWAVYVKDDSNWYAIDGNNAGSGSEVLLTSYVAGSVYQFDLSVDPTSQTYDVSVSANGGGTITLSELGFRTSATTAGPILNFMVSEAVTASVQNYSFDIDNIVVSAVPETSHMAVYLGAGVLALAVLLRRRK